MGWPLFVVSFAAIGLLTHLAHRAPAGLFYARTAVPLKRSRTMAVVGFLFFPAVLVTEFLEIGEMVPPAIVLFMVVVVQGLFLLILLD